MTVQSVIIESRRTRDAVIPMNRDDDRSVILATRGGDSDAFGVLVVKYRQRAVRVAAAIVGDLEMARDLTQDAFIKAYRSLGRFDCESPFLPWFYRILKNICLDHLRRRVRFRKVVDQVTSTASRTIDMLEGVQKQEIAKRVRDAVATLPEKDREIIELKHFADLSYEEISQVLEIPKGTVMSRLFYARKALRKKLEQTIDCLEAGCE